MSEAVLAAVITGFLTLIGQFFTSRGQQSRMMDAFQHQSEMTDAKLSGEIAKNHAVTQTQITNLTNEVRAHNEFAKRIPAIEARLDALDAMVRRKP